MFTTKSHSSAFCSLSMVNTKHAKVKLQNILVIFHIIMIMLQGQEKKSPACEAKWWAHVPFDKEGFRIEHISEDIGN